MSVPGRLFRVQTGSDLPLCFDEAMTDGWIHRLIVCLLFAETLLGVI